MLLSHKIIAKNSMMLYIRMLIITSISLITSRIILDALGVDDFGLYNVVASFVLMFAFINTALSSATQRFLNIEIGQNNINQLIKVYKTSKYLHNLIAVIVLIFAETIGLWFLIYKLDIPHNRLNAAIWVYQLSVLSTIVLILSVPYNALIIVHEKMSVFAYISLFEAFSKLIIVYLIKTSLFDKLILYAILLTILQILIRVIYGLYCRKFFIEVKNIGKWDSNTLKSMVSYSSWNLLGCLANVCNTQGLNLILNIFSGIAVNAARGLSMQIQSSLIGLSSNLQTAINPQITKNYAVKEFTTMHNLMYASCRYSTYLIFMISIPFLVDTSFILHLWLKEVPKYTEIFVKIVVIINLIQTISNPLTVGIVSTGKIKYFQIVSSLITLSVLPISYYALKYWGLPQSVFYISLLIEFLNFLIKIYFSIKLVSLNLNNFFKSVIINIFKFIVFSYLLVSILIFKIPSNNLTHLILVCIFSIIISILVVYFTCLTLKEKKFINDYITKLIH